MLLSFSRGKDAIAAYLALRADGIDVIPYHLYLVPGLEFVAESLAYYEKVFGVRIINMPHPSLYRWLNNAVFQPPERLSAIEAAELPEFDYEDVRRVCCEDYGLDADTWACSGVRACDSPQRRISFTRNGPLNQTLRKASVVWDWRKAEVLTQIEAAGIKLPVDYELWNRSFDGLGYRFLAPLKERLPRDYEKVLEWFPLADLEIFRHERLR